MKLGPYELGPNETPENGIYTGDARELAKAIPDESVDLVLTDPPYLQEYIYLYEWLGKEANRLLSDGGYCFSYFGLAFAPQVLTGLLKHLNYYWFLSTQHTGGYPMFWSKSVMSAWKPIAICTKGKGDKHKVFVDWFNGEGKNKKYHEWGQGESLPKLILDKFAKPGAIIFDPFTGGGTVPAVCKQLGRRYLAFEIDPDTADLARERVRNTQPPLFTLEPQQLELDPNLP